MPQLMNIVLVNIIRLSAVVFAADSLPLPPPSVFTLLSGEVVSGQLTFALLWSANPPPNLKLKWVLSVRGVVEWEEVGWDGW